MLTQEHVETKVDGAGYVANAESNARIAILSRVFISFLKKKNQNRDEQRSLSKV